MIGENKKSEEKASQTTKREKQTNKQTKKTKPTGQQRKKANKQEKTYRPTKCSEVHSHTLECEYLANLIVLVYSIVWTKEHEICVIQYILWWF